MKWGLVLFLTIHWQENLLTFRSVKAGDIAIRDAFLQSEEGYVFLVTVDNTKEFDLTPLYCKDIPLDYLPEPDDFLSYSQTQVSLDADTIKADR